MNNQIVIDNPTAETQVSAAETEATPVSAPEISDAAVVAAASDVATEAAQDTASEAAPGTAPEASSQAASSKRRTGDRMSVASFVLGLISVVLLPLGTIPGFLGFVLSLDAKKRGSNHSLLTAGRIMSIIGMITVPALYLFLLIWSYSMVLLMM